MSQLAQAKSFFATMANKYKGQNNIIYEICNEPNGCSWSTIKSYARQVIKVIRKYDKKAIIAVGTPTWSQLGSDGTHNEVADSPITGYKNIVYSLHFYANEWSHNEYLPAKLTYARKKGIAVMVTEFGMSAASGGGGISTQNTTLWLKRLNAANVSYFCWSLSNKNESCSLLSPNTKKTSGWKTTDLSAAGRYIRLKYRARKKALGNRA
jgi:endoglucanase